jgi:hypothetical protein
MLLTPLLQHAMNEKNLHWPGSSAIQSLSKPHTKVKEHQKSRHQNTADDIRGGFHLLMLEAFELGSSVLQLWQLIGPAYPCSVSS